MESNASPAPLDCTVGRIFLAATVYAEAHMQACAKDLVTWHKTGICPEGAFRVCAGMIPVGLDQMQMAEFIVTRAALFVTAYPPNTKLTRPASESVPATGADGLGASDLLANHPLQENKP